MYNWKSKNVADQIENWWTRSRASRIYSRWLYLLYSYAEVYHEFLCPRVLRTLFDTWLLACWSDVFPSPPMWRTFNELASEWMHERALIDHWFRTVMLLSFQLQGILYKLDPPDYFLGIGWSLIDISRIRSHSLIFLHYPVIELFISAVSLDKSTIFEFTSLNLCYPVSSLIGLFRTYLFLLDGDFLRLQPSKSVTKDRILQTWFRYLHLIGNPVDFCHSVRTATRRMMGTSGATGAYDGSGKAAFDGGKDLSSMGVQMPEFGLSSGKGLMVDDLEGWEHVLRLPDEQAELFQRAMTALAILVDLFLGISRKPKPPPVCLPFSLRYSKDS